MELKKKNRIIVSAIGKGIRVSTHEEDVDRLIVSLKRNITITVYYLKIRFMFQ
jgi:hypothetical protein